MKNNRFNLILIVVVLIGAVFSATLNWQRYNVEKVNNTVEQSVEYGAVRRLAYSEGISIEKTLKLLKERGVTTLVLFDTNLERLSETGEVNVFKGTELIKNIAIGNLNNTVWEELAKESKLSANAVYITKAKSASVFKDVKEDVFLRFGKEKVNLIAKSPEIIEIKGDLTPKNIYEGNKYQRGLMNLDLGILTKELLVAKNNDMFVCLRPVNYANLDNMGSASVKEQIDSLFARIDRSGAKVTAFAGSGKYLLGYNWNLDYVAGKLNERNITLAMIESPVQLKFINLSGLIEMAPLVDYNVVRTYVVGQNELNKIDFITAVRRWSLTDKERNVRFNYFKNITVPRPGETLFQTNLEYFGDITKRVKADGFKIGRADTYDAYMPDHKLMIPIVFGIVAGAILCLNQLYLLKRKYQYGLLVTIGSLGSFLVVNSYALLTRQSLAIGAAITIPVVAMAYAIEYFEHNFASKEINIRNKENLFKILLKTTIAIILTTCVSLIGASFLAAILGDIRFLLEIEIYRGVKLTFVLPMLLFALIMVRKYYAHKRYSSAELIVKFKAVLNRPITVKYVLFGLMFLFVGLIYIGRSGHTSGIPVSGLEIKLRWFLEDVMYARPRTKEFLIGHPMFYLLAFAYFKNFATKWKILIAVGATMGQSSLVQTFCHMRTPIYMSFIRAWDGVELGAILGVIGVCCFAILYYLYLKIRKDYFTHE